MKSNVIKKIGFAIFKDKKILLARSHKNAEVFYLIGGKIEEGEGDAECLVREVKEETGSEVVVQSLKFLTECNGPADGKENTFLQMRVYTGEYLNEPMPSREIAELRYFDTTADPKQVSVTAREQVFPWLKDNGYIN